MKKILLAGLLALVACAAKVTPQTPTSELKHMATVAEPTGKKYPNEWFAAVSSAGKPDWEILPQDAGPNEVILSKRNELGLLSNFAATPFTYKGEKFASVEGFWQSLKYPEDDDDERYERSMGRPEIQWKHTREEVAAMTGFEAKRAGDLANANMKRLGIDWVTFQHERMPYESAKPGLHYQLIMDAEWAKLRQNKNVQDILLKTGDLVLKPDHTQKPSEPPEWRYNELWMKIREAYRQELKLKK